MINQKELKKIIHYNPDTGALQQRVRFDVPDVSLHKGKVQIKGERYHVRDLIWLYMTGEWPDHCLYWVTEDKSDLRWSNITRYQYESHRKQVGTNARNKSGCVGVWWSERRQKWIARIQQNGKTRNLGEFYYKEDAVIARKLAEIS